MFSLKSTFSLGLISLIAFNIANLAEAGCPCKRSGGSMTNGAALAPIPYQGSQYTANYSGPVGQPFVAQGYGAAMPGSSGSPLSVSGPMVSPYQYQYHQQQIQQGGPIPPPGTVGQTFKLPSRPVPVEKHPRVGMIDVKVQDADEVFVHDMNAMRTEDTIEGFRDAKDPNVWHFESKPLYPGLDHIYRIQANFNQEDGSIKKSERYVRLIMGRLVELTF